MKTRILTSIATAFLFGCFLFSGPETAFSQILRKNAPILPSAKKTEQDKRKQEPVRKEQHNPVQNHKTPNSPILPTGKHDPIGPDYHKSDPKINHPVQPGKPQVPQPTVKKMEPSRPEAHKPEPPRVEPPKPVPAKPRNTGISGFFRSFFR